VPAAGCFPNGQNYSNVWFTFTATSTSFIEIDVQVDGTAGGYGTLYRPGIAVCTDPTNSATYLTCGPSPALNSGSGKATFTSSTLTPGNVYYINITGWSNSTGSFTISLVDQSPLGFDYYQDPTDLTAKIDNYNAATDNHLYSNANATPDGAVPGASCFPGGVNNDNVWFTFTASTTMMRVDVSVDNTTTGLGNLYRAGVAVCTNPAVSSYFPCGPNSSLNGNTGTATITVTGLTVGAKYYITVNSWANASGSFTIALTDHDNDSYTTPTLLTNLNGGCYSGTTDYSTASASADGPKPACWLSPVKENRWFMFQAIGSTVTVTMTSTGAPAIFRGELALYSTGQTSLPLTIPLLANVLKCAAEATTELISVTNATTQGQYYYIEVDDWGNAGNFQLCITSGGSTYYAIAQGNWNNGANWSLTNGGLAAGTYPHIADVANISGYGITVTDAENVGTLNVTVQSAATSLTIDGSTGGALTVNGPLLVTNAGQAFSGNVTVENNGTLTTTDVVTYTCSGAGASNPFQLTVGTGAGDNSIMTVAKDMTWNVSGGTTTNNLTLNGGSTLTLNHDMDLTYTGGGMINVALNNTSQLSVARNVNYSTASPGTELISLNNTSVFNIGEGFSQSVAGEGQFTSASGATLVFNGVTNANSFLGTGTAPEGFTLYNVTVNNTFNASPELDLNGPLTLQGGGVLTLTSGVVKGSATNLVTLSAGCTVSPNGGSTVSYVDGPIQKIGSTDFIFPTGNKGLWRRISITSLTGTSTFQAQYFDNVYLNAATAITVAAAPAPALTKTSALEYWMLNKISGGNGIVTLYWENSTNSAITDCSDLQVAHWNGTAWEDPYNATTFTTGCTGTTPGLTGTISTGAVVTSYSPFTFGSISGVSTVNALPIEMLYFKGEKESNTTELSWATASETNSNYFTLEKSGDGIHFEQIAQLPGAGPGTSNTTRNYSFTDHAPYNGTNYYYLTETDLNGDIISVNPISVTFNLPENFSVFEYPNPVKNEPINLKFTGLQDNDVLVVLRDALGREIYSKVVMIEKNDFLYEISSEETIPPGVYLIVATCKDQYYSKKLIVQ
jgi:hypothetical protein